VKEQTFEFGVTLEKFYIGPKITRAIDLEIYANYFNEFIVEFKATKWHHHDVHI
jgi:hypothetical protein